MRYYYKFSEHCKREDMFEDRARCGMPFDDIPPITLYLETPEIREDYENNDNTEWWLVENKQIQKVDFNSPEEAEDAYYAEVGFNWYCYLHDC